MTDPRVVIPRQAAARELPSAPIYMSDAEIQAVLSDLTNEVCFQLIAAGKAYDDEIPWRLAHSVTLDDCGRYWAITEALLPGERPIGDG